MPAPVRRIVTTASGTGRSRVLFDGPAPQTLTSLTELWRTGIGGDADADLSIGSDRIEPPAGGTVFRFFEVPAASASPATEAETEAAAWFEAMNSAHLRVDTRRDPNMHMSDTTDYIILLSGSITLVLDDQEVALKPFDTVVQRATNHSWRNDGAETAVLMAVLVSET